MTNAVQLKNSKSCASLDVNNKVICTTSLITYLLPNAVQLWIRKTYTQSASGLGKNVCLMQDNFKENVSRYLNNKIICTSGQTESIEVLDNSTCQIQKSFGTEIPLPEAILHSYQYQSEPPLICLLSDSIYQYSKYCPYKIWGRHLHLQRHPITCVNVLTPLPECNYLQVISCGNCIHIDTDIWTIMTHDRRSFWRTINKLRSFMKYEMSTMVHKFDLSWPWPDVRWRNSNPSKHTKHSLKRWNTLYQIFTIRSHLISISWNKN